MFHSLLSRRLVRPRAVLGPLARREAQDCAAASNSSCATTFYHQADLLRLLGRHLLAKKENFPVARPMPRD